MKIEITTRDEENGHYDIHVDGIRRYKIRGCPGSQTLYEDVPRANPITFPNVTSAINLIMATFIKDPVAEFTL